MTAVSVRDKKPPDTKLGGRKELESMLLRNAVIPISVLALGGFDHHSRLLFAADRRGEAE